MQFFDDADYFIVLDYVNLVIFTINGVGGNIVEIQDPSNGGAPEVRVRVRESYYEEEKVPLEEEKVPLEEHKQRSVPSKMKCPPKKDARNTKKDYLISGSSQADSIEALERLLRNEQKEIDELERSIQRSRSKKESELSFNFSILDGSKSERF